MKRALFLFCCILIPLITNAQTSTYTISGKITRANGEAIAGVTVFIDASNLVTATDDQGNYRFSGLASGTYTLTANIIGYTSGKENVIVNDQAGIWNPVLQEKSIQLATVNIGKSKNQDEFLKLFRKYFMGDSENAKACKILNPEVLNFSTNKLSLEATTDDFLLIENVNLGYQLKYLLRKFTCNDATDVTFYEGECLFEPLKGTAEQQQRWTNNRKKAYVGSMMHYLRALYVNRTREEGFLTYAMQNVLPPVVISPNPVATQQIVRRVDSNFIALTYTKRLYVVYDKKKAEDTPKLSNRDSEVRELEKMGSILMLNAQIDNRGKYSDQQKLLIQGFWGKKRIGDQLPFDYTPDSN